MSACRSRTATDLACPCRRGDRVVAGFAAPAHIRNWYYPEVADTTRLRRLSENKPDLRREGPESTLLTKRLPMLQCGNLRIYENFRCLSRSQCNQHEVSFRRCMARPHGEDAWQSTSEGDNSYFCLAVPRRRGHSSYARRRRANYRAKTPAGSSATLAGRGVRFARVSGDDGQTPVTAGGQFRSHAWWSTLSLPSLSPSLLPCCCGGSPLPHAGHKITLTMNETDGGALPVRGCASRACSAP